MHSHRTRTAVILAISAFVAPAGVYFSNSTNELRMCTSSYYTGPYRDLDVQCTYRRTAVQYVRVASFLLANASSVMTSPRHASPRAHPRRTSGA
jgi:hypothetical protein